MKHDIEMRRTGKISCPHCGAPLTDEQLKRLHGQHMLSKRKTPPKAGPGRPKKKVDRG